MTRRLVPLSIAMAVLYAVLAIGAANCLVIHAEQPPSHHHSQSQVSHSALCAWACQTNPTEIVTASLPLAAVSTVVARLSLADSTADTTFFRLLFASRAPPLV